MFILRSPEHYFENLPGYPFKPEYLEIHGARVHYIDEGEGEIILCLHGEPSWSYLYRKFFPVLSPSYRVIAPDLIGFGKSDKFGDIKDYTFKMHLEMVLEFLEKLDLSGITLVCQDWGGLLGLSAVGQVPDRFSRLVIMNTTLPIGNRPMPLAFKAWKLFATKSPLFPIGKVIKLGTYQPISDEVIAAYNAPFPNKKYKAGARAFPAMVPEKPEDQGVAEMKKARKVLGEWQKPALVMFSDKDPIMRGAHKMFLSLIPSTHLEEYIEIKDAGHFLQEDKGEEIAGYIKSFMEKTASG